MDREQRKIEATERLFARIIPRRRRRKEARQSAQREESVSTADEPYKCRKCWQPQGARHMTGCDQCDKWFHTTCLKLSIKQAESLEKFVCNACNASLTSPKNEVINSTSGLDNSVNTPCSLPAALHAGYGFVASPLKSESDSALSGHTPSGLNSTSPFKVDDLDKPNSKSSNAVRNLNSMFVSPESKVPLKSEKINAVTPNDNVPVQGNGMLPHSNPPSGVLTSTSPSKENVNEVKSSPGASYFVKLSTESRNPNSLPRINMDEISSVPSFVKISKKKSLSLKKRPPAGKTITPATENSKENAGHVHFGFVASRLKTEPDSSLSGCTPSGLKSTSPFKVDDLDLDDSSLSGCTPSGLKSTSPFKVDDLDKPNSKSSNAVRNLTSLFVSPGWKVPLKSEKNNAVTPNDNVPVQGDGSLPHKKKSLTTKKAALPASNSKQTPPGERLKSKEYFKPDLSPDFKTPKNRPSSKPKQSITPDLSSVVKMPKNTSLTDKISCQYCQACFTIRSNCYRHESICSGNSKSSRQYSCPSCSATFNRMDNLKSHSKKCSGIAKRPSSFRRSPCLIADCGLDFCHKTTLIEHLKAVHQDDISLKDTQHLEFASIDLFHEWKEEEEAATFSYFCQKKGQANATIKHFYCQHDGTGKCHSVRKTTRCNSKQRIKVGHFCIAKMKVWQTEDGTIKVEYYPTHNHVCKAEDLHHQPLPRSLDRFINQQLAWGVPPSTVFENVRKSIPRNTDNIRNVKTNIVTRKRIRERSRKRREALRLHKDDAKAVYLLVKNLIQTEDCILLYKPYGSPVVHGPSEINNLPESKELFLLGIQTDRQRKLMEELSGKILVVDETHGTNPYKFKLLTVLVVDDNRRGWPVGHLITSKSDADTLKFFFQCIKEKSNSNLNINCVITDDDPALINSMNDGFDSELISSMNLGFCKKLRHLLCIWHVIKNFKENLNGKVPRDHVEPMLQELRVLINCKDQNLFKKLCEGFIQKYQSNNKTSKFIKYFKKHYMNRLEKWAMCFRNFPHGEVNTTGHIESFHARLKKVHLKRKVNRRLDDLINILLTIEWEDHCSREREACHGVTALPQHIHERHERGIKIGDNDVYEVLDQKWEVNATSSSNLQYLVVRNAEVCSADLCFAKCTNGSCPGLCSHLYSCSCPDTHPLCKHIHKVHSMISKGSIKLENSGNDFYILPTEETVPCEDGKSSQVVSPKLSVATARLDRNMAVLSNFINSVHEKKVTVSEVTHVDAVLNDVVLRIQHLVENNDDEIINVPKMQPAVHYNSSEKLKTQVEQLSAFKRPPKKKKKKDLAEMAQKKASVVEDLLGFIKKEDEIVDDPSDPTDVLLFCGPEKLSLIHLKSLDLKLPDHEVEMYKKSDPIFKVGWLYSSVINAFFFKLSMNYQDVFLMSSDLAIRAGNKISNVSYLQRHLTSQMRVVFLPANINNAHWILLTISLKESKVIYYDPLQSPVSESGFILLSQVKTDLEVLFPSLSWEIHVVEMQKQTDSVNCGPNICHFGEKIAKSEVPCYIKCHHTFRQYMYSYIVGGCLRTDYGVENCGLCCVPYSSELEESSDMWVRCSQCHQWFHCSCVGFNRTSDTNFICPL